MKALVILFIIFLTFPNAWAQTKPAQTLPATQPATQPAPALTLTEAEKKGIVGRDLIFHRKYDEAMEYFKRMAVEDPDSPMGTFGQMAVWQSRMFENFDYSFDKEFEEVSNLNKKIVEKTLENKNASPWDLFLAGASSGVRGFYLMRKDSPIRALGEAGQAKKALHRALERDPGFADAYLGLGMYDYWRSVFTNRFKFLPFFSDKRKEGIAQAEKAYREGRVIAPLAEAALGFSYYEERNPKGITLLESFLKKYPEYIIAKNLLGDLYSARGLYAKAHAIFDDMIRTTPEVKVAKFFKAKTYFRQGDLTEARKWYDDFLALNPPRAWISYALTDLGLIDLKEKKENEAYEKFKKAYRAYPDNSYPLKQLQKLRGPRW